MAHLVSSESDMPSDRIPLEFDRAHSRLLIGAPKCRKAHVLHCSYYNNYLQRTIWKDAEAFVESEPLLIGAAVEQSYHHLKGMFADFDIKCVEARKAFAGAFFAWQGFGLLDFDPLTEAGGVTVSESQHYAEGWREQFGRSQEPVGLMTRGWLAGAAAAIYDLPQGHFATRQAECAAVTGGRRNVFEIKAGEPNYSLFGHTDVGSLSRSPLILPEEHGNIDPEAIGNAVMMLPLFGSEQTDGGLIKNFDVLITWHSHQYYDRISFECVREAIHKFGDEGRHAVEPLLEEAGHRCAFRTFGGIWRSPEWEALVEPLCKTREDWIHGLIAIINCAGWGRVQCVELSEEEAVFVVHDDYESVGYIDLYGKAEFMPTYLMPGGFRGMMNLVFNENIHEKPALTEELYDRMCRRARRYSTIVERCRAMGDEYSVYRVSRGNT